MEIVTLSLFCAALLLCVLSGLSILYALLIGLIIFSLYGKKKGYRWSELAQMSFAGIKTVKNILITFVLIGVLTALWRDAGTIPIIVCYAIKLIQPSLFLVMVFLLNCLVSILTGTAFGTAATMGVICATIAAAMQINPLLVGGAVLSGVYFGDRCSPVSTSALLIAELTQTNIIQNIKGMLRSSWVPFLITCVLYVLAGLQSGHLGEVPNLQALFSREFTLSWVAVLPAVVIIVISLLQVNVKATITASILTSLPICILVQNTPVTDLPRLILLGYSAADAEAASMLNGGGIISMLKVTAIVCLSSSYSGIFQKTGLLDRAKLAINVLSERTTSYTAILCTSIVSGIIACNQTLTIILAHQLCNQAESDNKRLAIHLEDTAVVAAPLVPWSIAGAVPLASIGAPSSSVFFACFLYLLPIWRLAVELLTRRNILKKRKLNDSEEALYR